MLFDGGCLNAVDGGCLSAVRWRLFECCLMEVV